MAAKPTIVVHVGPSLAGWKRLDRPDTIWLPPAVAGDAVRAESFNPCTFVLIDGLFDGPCAIRHNELLQLMHQGVRVIGGASMGALRAAELHTFGMEGCGRIYDAFIDGRLTGDDEVALLHGPAEFGWAPLTTPLVNVRASLIAGRRQRLLSRTRARHLLETAKKVSYRRRTWSAIGLLESIPSQFQDWLDKTGGVDLKARDAMKTLCVAFEKRRTVAIPSPPMTSFSRALARKILE